MAAPVGRDVGEGREPVRDTMVDLLLVRISFRITLTDTLGNHAGIALGMASVLAVLALHSGRVLEEVSAESTAHDVVELVLHKLVAVHLVNLLLALADSALSSETQIDLASVLVGLDKAHLKLYLTGRLEVKPPIDGARVDLGGLRARSSIGAGLIWGLW